MGLKFHDSEFGVWSLEFASRRVFISECRFEIWNQIRAPGRIFEFEYELRDAIKRRLYCAVNISRGWGYLNCRKGTSEGADKFRFGSAGSDCACMIVRKRDIPLHMLPMY